MAHKAENKRTWVEANRTSLQPYKEHLLSKYIEIRDQDLNNIHDQNLSLVEKGKAKILMELIIELTIQKEGER